MTARLARPASRPQWGRVPRGVVWHVVPAAYRDLGAGQSTWCGKTTPHADLLDGLVPDNARVCPDCCSAVFEFAQSVGRAAGESERIHTSTHDDDLAYDGPETYRGRPIEDVDLLGQLTADDEDGDR